MGRVLFIGDIESPQIMEAIKQLISSGKEIVISMSSAELLNVTFHDQAEIVSKIKTWSWDEETADYYIGDHVMDVIPYIYPNTINQEVMKLILSESYIPQKTYKNFRLGFGVQEELFDLFVANVVGASEIVYYEVLSSMQLLNPAGQLEYRRRSYGFFEYVDKEIDIWGDIELVKKRYRIVGEIPFYEEFSKKYGHPVHVFHYLIKNRE
ncbi:MAG TPA: hypothetical protein DCW90_14950 [Lachnospiraceae bacterium]|nr:hypothetical protein [uncultured Lachnoclostridium sp.]HAU86733.1 hypothetical protein [Lachnospiraceae bacterium]